MGKESICCGLLCGVKWGTMRDEFCRAARGAETACPIFPDSILPIAHYGRTEGHINISRAQEFTQ